MESEKEELQGIALQEERQNKLIEIIRENHPAEELIDLISDYHEYDVAEILGKLEKHERARLYAILDDETLSEIFAYLDNPSEFVEELSADKAADIIEEMDSDDAVDVLEELDEGKKQEIIDLLEEDAAKDVKLVAKFDDDQIGSLMTNDFIVISEDFTVKKAMKSLVEQAAENDNITTIYVTDQKGIYKGAFSLKDLFIARANVPLEDIIVTSYPYLTASDKIEDVIEKVKDYAEESLPVLDGDNRLIGALTSDSVIEATESEYIEDYTKLAAISDYEENNNSLKKNILTRLPWLIILLILGLLVSATISCFDFVIAVLPLTAFFQPMILGMSGNAGTQSLAVTIRALTEQPGKRELRKRMAKEVLLALMNGLILAVISFVVLGLYIAFFKGQSFESAFVLSGCIAMALLISITVSGLCGCAVPVVFKKVGIDPAAASGPLITTASDLVSSVTFYGLCALFLLI